MHCKNLHARGNKMFSYRRQVKPVGKLLGLVVQRSQHGLAQKSLIVHSSIFNTLYGSRGYKMLWKKSWCILFVASLLIFLAFSPEYIPDSKSFPLLQRLLDFLRKQWAIARSNWDRQLLKAQWMLFERGSRSPPPTFIKKEKAKIKRPHRRQGWKLTNHKILLRR